MQSPFALFAIAFIAAACTTTSPLDDYEEVTTTPIMEAPATQPGETGALATELIEHGRYLVELIGCPACHTPGALIGEPDFDRWLAGSSVGIAYSNPMKYDEPGVVFPSNLTPDPETGIGSQSDEELAEAIREGRSSHGLGQILVMPWLAYSKLSDNDTAAIVAYLRSLPPIENRVPAQVPPGSRTDQLYVHFGVYRSRR